MVFSMKKTIHMSHMRLQYHHLYMEFDPEEGWPGLYLHPLLGRWFWWELPEKGALDGSFCFLQKLPRERKIRWSTIRVVFFENKPLLYASPHDVGAFLLGRFLMPCSWGRPGHDSVVTSTKVCLFQRHEIWQLRFYVIHLAGPRRLENDLLSLNWEWKGGKRQRQDNSNNNMIHWFIDWFIWAWVKAKHLQMDCCSHAKHPVMFKFVFV